MTAQEPKRVDHPNATKLWLPLGLSLASCILYLASEIYVFSGRLALPLDDSWIHLHFARQLASGEGLAYNSGDWIPGSTAPLWTALLSLGFVLPGNPLLWAKLLGILFFLGSVSATDRLAAELGLGQGLRRLAAVLTATTPWLVWSALSGMEITLFACLSLWAIVFHLRERRGFRQPPLSIALFAASTLARPEGILLLILAGLDRVVRFDNVKLDLQKPGHTVSGKEIGHWIALTAAILGPMWAFTYWISGSILPTTFAVKSSSSLNFVPSGRYLSTVLDIVFRSQPVMLLLAGAGLLRLVERLGSRRDRGLLPALWPFGLALAYSFLASPRGPIVVGNFGRYYFPILPLVIVLGVLGLEEAARRVRVHDGSTVRRLGLRTLPLALILLPQIWGLASGAPRYLQTLANVEDSDVKAALWLAERLPASALIATQDIGAIKYHLPNRILDLAGIVNPDILPALHGTGLQDKTYWEDRLLRYLAQQEPDYLVLFPRSYPKISSGTPGFSKIHSFDIRQNVTMAGDELAIYSTPWTQHRLRDLPR